jgi:hypothetical protein
MQLPARTPVYAVRLLAGLAPLSVLVLATVNGKQPTVPAPAPTVHGERVRLQNPLPAPAPVNGQKNGDKNGDKNGNGETGPEMSLGECIAIALERQPSLKAVKDSTAATEAGYRALTNFGTVGTIISQQKELADYAVLRMQLLVDVGQRLLDTEKDPKNLEGFTTLKLQLMKNGLLEARKLRATATIGRQKALAGLREVMAVDGRTFPFQIKDDAMPLMKQGVELTMDRVVELALERRPELVLAAAGVDAFRLEVYAQGRIPFRRVVPTLASGADIHAKDIPQTIRTATEYRPGAILPEMPTQLVGSKYDRVCRAMAFAQKAEAVYEKARNLIIVEAESTFLDFELASEKLTYAKQQFEISKDVQQRVVAQQDSTKAKDQLLLAEVEAAKAQSSYLQAVQEYLLALAALERVTAGGIRPAFPGR